MFKSHVVKKFHSTRQNCKSSSFIHFIWNTNCKKEKKNCVYTWHFPFRDLCTCALKITSISYLFLSWIPIAVVSWIPIAVLMCSFFRGDFFGKIPRRWLQSSWSLMHVQQEKRKVDTEFWTAQSDLMGS